MPLSQVRLTPGLTDSATSCSFPSSICAGYEEERNAGVHQRQDVATLTACGQASQPAGQSTRVCLLSPALQSIVMQRLCFPDASLHTAFCAERGVPSIIPVHS